MNPNDILAQQQAYLNQAVERSQHMMWGVIAIYLALFIIGLVVLFLFYARLRDIADELRKLRVAFELSEDRKARATSSSRQPANPSGEDRYMPKPR
jgi:hypothetical protein